MASGDRPDLWTADPDRWDALLERDAELAELAALAEAARSGSGSLVVVEGPAGIGKSRLLHEACSEAARRGMVVLSARGTQIERDFGFGAACQLFEARARMASRARRRRLFAGSAGLVRPLLLGSRDGGRLLAGELVTALHGLYWLCVNLTELAPVVLAIDDAHWVDPPTLRWLRYLAPRLDGLALLVLVAVRSDEPLGHDEDLAEVRAGPETRTLRLSHLSQTAVTAMIRAAMGEAAAREFCGACAEVTGGNPLYVRELIVSLVADGVVPAVEAAASVLAQSPASIAAAVVRRLRRHAAALRLAQAVAVLGHAPDLQVAAVLAGLDHVTATGAADLLAAMGVLRPGWPLDFVHPIVRTAIYGNLPAGERALLHRRAAGLLDAAGESPDAVAGQLLASEPAGEEWSVEALRRAARHAMARGAPESALAYLRRALAERPPAAARAAVLREAGMAAFQCGDPGGGEYLKEALALAHEPVMRAEIALVLGRALLLADRVEAAVEVLWSGLGQLGAAPVLSLGIETQLISTGLLHPSTWIRSRERLARWRAEQPPDSPDGRRLTACLAMWSMLDGEPATAVRDVAERALSAGRLLAENTAASTFFHLAANALACADWLGLALHLFDLALEDARRRGSLTGFTLTSCFRADANYRAGRLADAEADARAALAARNLGERSLLAPMALAELIQVLIERGELELAAAALGEHGIDPDAGDGFGQCAMRYARGRLRLSRGMAEDGLQDLMACGRWLERWGSCNPSLWPWRSDVAVGLAVQGRAAEARRLALEEVDLARPLQQPRTLGMALRAAGLVQGADSGLEMLRESVETLASSPAPLEYARALVDLGSAIRRAGGSRDARRPLHEGLDLADRCGATGLAARARQELAVAGGRPRRPRLSGVLALTPSERRVAQMAARGMSNRQIAEALFLSVKTVETHLGRGFDKLEITSRRELAGVLADGRS